VLRLLSKGGVMDKFKPAAVKKVRATKPRKTKLTVKTKSTTEESS